jgi:hypothetical protein
MVNRVPRSVEEMFARLGEHISLLDEFAKRLFTDGDERYLGDLAGKLRLLVCEFRAHKPLLLSLIDELKADDSIILGGPPMFKREGTPSPGDRVSLRQYLQQIAYGTRIEGQGFVTVSKSDLIRMIAEQYGGAHEDWALDPRLEAARASGLFIGDMPAIVAELRVTTGTVLHVARRILARGLP